MNTLCRLSLLFVLAMLGLSAQAGARDVRHRAATKDVVLLEEDFSKFTKGSEASPDPHDLCLKELDWCISPSLLQTPGWNGGGIYQAGGCACIYGYQDDKSGLFELGYLESPRFDASACQGTFIVCFRARSVLEQEWFGVCGVPDQGKAEQKFAVIGKEWANYEVTLNCGDGSTRVQFEPLDDQCFIDDIRIIQVYSDEGGNTPQYDLPTPASPYVSNYSSKGYTAHWGASAGAEDYALYDYLYHTAVTDGEAFDYINADFSRVIAGSESMPVSPGSDRDFSILLDDVTDRADWLLYMPMFAGGCIGVDNSMGAMMPAGIESPNLHVCKDLPLYIEFDVRSDNLSTLNLYSYGATAALGETQLEVTPKWTRKRVTLSKSPEQVSLEFVVADAEPGYMFFDNLHVWQELPQGTTASVAYSYLETPATSIYVPTSTTPSGYRHAFIVSAYQYAYDEEGDIVDYTMSAWTSPVFADGQPAERVVRVRLSVDSASTFDIFGRHCQDQPVGAGLYVRGGKKILK